MDTVEGPGKEEVGDLVNRLRKTTSQPLNPDANNIEAGPTMRDRIDDDFNYHRETPITVPRHNAVREILKGTAHALTSLVPSGREQSLMLTALEEAMHWANAGIAKRGNDLL